MLLMIDNFDSFTYNIVQYIGELGAEILVKRSDEITYNELKSMDVEKMFISPGPCSPKEAVSSCEAVRFCAENRVPLLGICLGHQCIAHVFGGDIVKASRLMHGKTSPIRHDSTGVFSNIPCPFEATRYHSLVLDRHSCPKTFCVNADTEDGVIMGIRHEKLPIHGVQFHPESILTEYGHRIIENFLKLKKGF